MYTYYSAKALDSNRKIVVDVPEDLDIKTGDKVIVKSEIGEIVAEYLGPFKTLVILEEKEKFPIVRKATEEDLFIWRKKREILDRIIQTARQKVKEYPIPMSLFTGEIAIKGHTATLFFTSSGRVDFRALVRDLQETFNMKIRLWQGGVRDRAQMLGGIGICGRPLCCHKHILAFDNVSIYMAKRQLSVFNPSRISGQCGRLMCCLRYEDNIYVDAEENNFPQVGDVVVLDNGEKGKVMTRNIFLNMVYVHTDRGGQSWIDLEEVSEVWRKGKLVTSKNTESVDSKEGMENTQIGEGDNIVE